MAMKTSGTDILYVDSLNHIVAIEPFGYDSLASGKMTAYMTESFYRGAYLVADSEE